MKVMVIDPDPASSSEVPSHFQGNTDFDIALAASVEDALYPLQHEPFEAVFLTVEHANPEAIATVQNLAGQFPSLRVGLIIEHPTAADAHAAAPHAPLGVIRKPLDPEKLLLALHGQGHQQATVVASAGATQASPAPGDPGALANFNLVDVIQMCCISQKGGRLHVHGPGHEGFIYLQGGAVVHADLPGLEGEAAVYEMIGWNDAQATLDENIGAPKITISAGYEHLLMEGVRRKDERGETTGPDLRSDAGGDQLIGKMVGPFKVRKKLASDFWGTLYEALQVAVNRPVALKVLSPGFYDDQEQCHQFIAFAGAMAKAQNPYITAVYEAGQGNGLIFYAREHVEGANLKERLKQGQVLPEDLALRVIINIGEALNYEKKNNILHTPLTLDDVLIPDTGVPKLLNNVTMDGGTLSGGEADEMIRLGAIVKQGMEGATMATPEFKSMLDRMRSAGQGGFPSWDVLLQEARQLDLNRRAMKVVRPLATTHVDIPPESAIKLKPWMLWAGIAACLVGIIGFAIWQFFIRVATEGAKDVDTMVAITEGPFTYGSKPGEQVTLPKFYIDKYEVTIGQYRKFLEAWTQNPSGIEEHPDLADRKDHTPDDWHLIQAAIKGTTRYRGVAVKDNMPVFNVNFWDAWAYAHWAGKRLPTEQEWEKAGRGPKGNMFPWGNDFDPRKANTGSDATQTPGDPNFGKTDGFGNWSPVGALRGDKSYYGVMDMGGNVSEWTDTFDANPDFPSSKVPVIRGGNWGITDASLTSRDCRQSSLQRKRQIGFRCAADNPPATK